MTDQKPEREVGPILPGPASSSSGLFSEQTVAYHTFDNHSGKQVESDSDSPAKNERGDRRAMDARCEEFAPVLAPRA